MTPEQITRIRSLPDQLTRRVLGQEAALTTVSALGRHWLAGVLEKAPRILLLGPTGVGKTQCALALSEALHGEPPLRIDMSEHQRPEALDVLLGNRSGDPGLLQQTFFGSPSRLLLLDEIEKAHPRVLDLLLQMLEPGHLTTASGVRLDLTTTPILCTSNLATAAVTDVRQLSAQALEDHVLEQVRRELRPETLNRFDAVVVFQPLDLGAQEKVLRLQLGQFLAWLATRNIRMTSSPEAERYLMLRGFDARWGARPLRRVIRFHIGEVIVEELLRGNPVSGQLVVEHQKLSLRRGSE